NRTICPGPHRRPARSVSAAGRASAENSDSCDTRRTLEHVFECAPPARRQLFFFSVWQLGALAAAASSSGLDCRSVVGSCSLDSSCSGATACGSAVTSSDTLFGSILSRAILAWSKDERMVVSADLILVTAASPLATGAGPAASSPEIAWSMDASLFPRKSDNALTAADGSFSSNCGFVESDSCSPSSEPHTLSVHWTGSVVAATAPPFVDAPVGAGEPVTVAEQPLRATAAAVTGRRRRVRERRIGDSVHAPPRGR